MYYLDLHFVQHVELHIFDYLEWYIIEVIFLSPLIQYIQHAFMYYKYVDM
jgi:hypothetical protein